MGADESEMQSPADPVGNRLAHAREAMGLSLADMVDHTRVQARFLKSIEASDYAALPGRAYAFGFVRSYAVQVGLDPDTIIRDLRLEMDMAEQAPADLVAAFTPGDPARVPSAKFAAIAGAAALLLAGGGYGLWHAFSVPDTNLPPLVTDTPAAPAPSAAPASAPTATPTVSGSSAAASAISGPVVFTALDSGLWVKFYDASGKTLMNKQMAVGETYTVPADATGPMLWTGRPEALAVAIGGHSIGKLDETRKTVHDLPVNAGALLARAASSAPRPTASGSALGLANRAAMPVASATGSFKLPASQSPSAPAGPAMQAHRVHHHSAAQPSGTPSGAAQVGAAAEKASTVSE